MSFEKSRDVWMNRVVFDSPYGRIEGEWRRRGSSVEYSLSVPTGVEGVIRLPGQEPVAIESGGRFQATLPLIAAVA